MKYIYLSHNLRNEIPIYGGSGSLNIKNIKSISKGNSVNVFSFGMESHWGTHVDCPAHFFENALKIVDYPAKTWFFNKPLVLNLNINDNRIIRAEDLNELTGDTDIVLIKTNFSRFRGTDIYSYNNPGFHPDTGLWLRKNHPSVRAIGFDFISLSSYRNKDIGKEAHRAFLDPAGDNAPVLIIEDMDLSCYIKGLSQVWVLPLRIEEIDSAPCTVIGVIE